MEPNWGFFALTWSIKLKLDVLKREHWNKACGLNQQKVEPFEYGTTGPEQRYGHPRAAGCTPCHPWLKWWRAHTHTHTRTHTHTHFFVHKHAKIDNWLHFTKYINIVIVCDKYLPLTCSHWSYVVLKLHLDSRFAFCFLLFAWTTGKNTPWSQKVWVGMIASSSGADECRWVQMSAVLLLECTRFKEPQSNSRNWFKQPSPWKTIWWVHCCWSLSAPVDQTYHF